MSSLWPLYCSSSTFVEDSTWSSSLRTAHSRIVLSHSNWENREPDPLDPCKGIRKKMLPSWSKLSAAEVRSIRFHTGCNISVFENQSYTHAARNTQRFWIRQRQVMIPRSRSKCEWYFNQKFATVKMSKLASFLNRCEAMFYHYYGMPHVLQVPTS